MKILPILLVLALTLAACGTAPQAAVPSASTSSSNTVSNPTPEPATTAAGEANPAYAQNTETATQTSNTEDLIRTDEQGAIVVEVTPVNLATPGESIEFEVGMNTHSVDLSMDLAALAMLTTDTGKTVQASQWDAPSGGHHVSGKLIFPAMVDGQPFLEGAKKLTLTIKDLDVPQRVFMWDLNP